MLNLNETHNSDLRSWVASANDGDTDFPIQNLHKAGVFPMELTPVLKTLYKPRLNKFMALGSKAWSSVRLHLSRALREGAPQAAQLEACLVSQAQAEYKVPARIGDYTDFYTSIHHATNVGKLFRPDNPLLPNYQWVPIGYHGRSSSIKVSGHEFHRPSGQLKAPDADAPILAPCKRLDYELEVGIYIGEGNKLGSPVALDDAENHVFGLCLFNDWCNHGSTGTVPTTLEPTRRSPTTTTVFRFARAAQ